MALDLAMCGVVWLAARIVLDWTMDNVDRMLANLLALRVANGNSARFPDIRGDKFCYSLVG